MNAVWSLTLYDGATTLLIKTPIDRTLIHSPMLDQMKRTADGALTLYIQKASAGADKESKELPAPDGPLSLVMRLTWPKTGTPSLLPPGAGRWKPAGVRGRTLLRACLKLRYGAESSLSALVPARRKTATPFAFVPAPRG